MRLWIPHLAGHAGTRAAWAAVDALVAGLIEHPRAGVKVRDPDSAGAAGIGGAFRCRPANPRCAGADAVDGHGAGAMVTAFGICRASLETAIEKVTRSPQRRRGWLKNAQARLVGRANEIAAAAFVLPVAQPARHVAAVGRRDRTGLDLRAARRRARSRAAARRSCLPSSTPGARSAAASAPRSASSPCSSRESSRASDATRARRASRAPRICAGSPQTSRATGAPFATASRANRRVEIAGIGRVRWLSPCTAAQEEEHDRRTTRMSETRHDASLLTVQASRRLEAEGPTHKA